MADLNSLGGIHYEMMRRCYNPKSVMWKWYGEKGIGVCEEWHDPKTFVQWAYSSGYNPKAKRGDCTIDRINNDGNYEPLNCRWVNMKVQANNKRKRKKNKKPE